MKARLVVFPIRGRNWCFSSRSVDISAAAESQSSQTPSTFKQLWRQISSSKSSSSHPAASSNAELLIDFVANKMNKAWTALEKAPPRSFKSKIHGLGLRLLAGVKPTEIFLKSIPNNITNVEVTYPSSLNARLVRRRLRHIAFRGSVLHKRYFYGSVSLLPLTSAFTGSEKLLHLVSDSSDSLKSSNGSNSTDETSVKGNTGSLGPPWVLQPSGELEKLLHSGDADDGLSRCTIEDICKRFDLNTQDVMKFQDSM